MHTYMYLTYIHMFTALIYSILQQYSNYYNKTKIIEIIFHHSTIKFVVFFIVIKIKIYYNVFLY